MDRKRATQDGCQVAMVMCGCFEACLMPYASRLPVRDGANKLTTTHTTPLTPKQLSRSM